MNAGKNQINQGKGSFSYLLSSTFNQEPKIIFFSSAFLAKDFLSLKNSIVFSFQSKNQTSQSD
jgi:hypothetical protein